MNTMLQELVDIRSPVRTAERISCAPSLSFHNCMVTLTKMFPTIVESDLVAITSETRARLVVNYVVSHFLKNSIPLDTIHTTNEIFDAAKQHALDVDLYGDGDSPLGPYSTIIAKRRMVANVANATTFDATPQHSGRGRKVDPNSPAQRSVSMYAQCPDMPRDEMVSRFETELGIQHNTAVVYYSKAKKAYREANA